MSLKIFTDKNKIVGKYIHNVEPYIMECGIVDNTFNREVIEKVEQGRYKSKSQIYDRFGQILPVDFISTSSKALIVTKEYPTYVFNFEEVGTNVGKVLKNITEGSVYIPPNILRVYEFGYEDSNVDIELDGKNFKTLSEFAYYISEVY